MPNGEWRRTIQHFRFEFRMITKIFNKMENDQRTARTEWAELAFMHRRSHNNIQIYCTELFLLLQVGSTN